MGTQGADLPRLQPAGRDRERREGEGGGRPRRQPNGCARGISSCRRVRAVPPPLSLLLFTATLKWRAAEIAVPVPPRQDTRPRGHGSPHPRRRRAPGVLPSPAPRHGREAPRGGMSRSPRGTLPAIPTLETMRGSPCSSPPRSVKPQGAPPCSCTCTYWGAPGRPSARSMAATATAPSRPGPELWRKLHPRPPGLSGAGRVRGGAAPHRGCSAAANEARGDGGGRFGTAQRGTAQHSSLHGSAHNGAAQHLSTQYLGMPSF